MKEPHKPQDDSRILGDINPKPGTQDTRPRDRRPGSNVDWDGEEGTDQNEPGREHPGSRDVGQSTEGIGGGTRNYRPGGTTGSDIGNRPE